MAEIGVSVQQQGRGNGADATVMTAAGNRQGALVVSSPQAMYDQWLRAGKVFENHASTAGTYVTVENNTAIDLTEPFFRMTCPSSKILVPLYIKVQGAVIWETADEFILYTSDTDTFSTGGLAGITHNMAAVSSLDSALGTTAMTNVFNGDTVLTEAAVTNPRVLDFTNRLTGDLFSPYIYNALNGSNPLTFIHGPSSLCLMIARTTTTIEVAYQVVWAELDKSELV